MMFSTYNQTSGARSSAESKAQAAETRRDRASAARNAEFVLVALAMDWCRTAASRISLTEGETLDDWWPSIYAEAIHATDCRPDLLAAELWKAGLWTHPGYKHVSQK